MKRKKLEEKNKKRKEKNKLVEMYDNKTDFDESFKKNFGNKKKCLGKKKTFLEQIIASEKPTGN